LAEDNTLNPVLGIDLGTTFSAIARWNGRGPEHYQMKTGEDTLQSVVFYNPERDELLVGQLAYNRGLRAPENMVMGVKRMMDDGRQEIVIGGKTFTPIELSARILERLYRDVQEKYPKDPQGRPLLQTRGTIVTVPYYFKAHQCENTRLAAEQANIDCIGIIQEPIAASLSYAWKLAMENENRDVKEKILVFDLGGGTFDLTLFDLYHTRDKLTFEVLATGGDDRLGGMDFDECLVKLLLEKGNLTLEGLPEQEQRRARQKLITQAIEAKITLSATEHTYVTVADVLPGQHIETEVTRAEFETVIERYTTEIQYLLESLWATANVKPSEVDRAILVGGSSKIPRMREILFSALGGDKVWADINPSLCVAEGAAMFAAYKDNRRVFDRDIEIKTRTSHALGIEITGGQFYIMIPANRKTPCSHPQTFTTNADDVTSLEIKVYQGSAKLVKDNTWIGTLEIPNLPPRPKGKLDINVLFKVSEEQMLSVTVEAEGMRKTAVLKFN